MGPWSGGVGRMLCAGLAFLLDKYLGKIYNTPSRFIHQLQRVLGMHHYIVLGLYMNLEEFYKCIIILF